ncbi:hypothetical protein L195_g005481 [Trifolium pratense]|uniref:Uncharacterized protein n=1 Tax=Trifolium pratense TaxID=57577 RepID=A0A2K3P0Y1_TRIPR|nr:hypothetical protein L195_g005481 [Trifolium pratense]
MTSSGQTFIKTNMSKSNGSNNLSPFHKKWQERTGTRFDDSMMEYERTHKQSTLFATFSPGDYGRGSARLLAETRRTSLDLQKCSVFIAGSSLGLAGRD